jgi:hypothetical protein
MMPPKNPAATAGVRVVQVLLILIIALNTRLDTL